jgi:hypothetical protein
MARTRSIKPGFFMNEELAELPCEARLLFIGLWTIADREGRLEDRPRKIKAAVFPYDDCDVDRLLGLLSGKGFLQRYKVRRQGYIQVSNFVKHQKPHPKEAPSEVPAMSENECEGSKGLEGEGPLDEEAPPSRERVGQSREKVGVSREMPDQARDASGLSPEQDRYGPGMPDIYKDRRGEEGQGQGGDERWARTGGNTTAGGGQVLSGPEAPGGKTTGSARSNSGVEAAARVKQVFEYWKARTEHTDAKLTREREMKIRGRLDEGYTVEDLKEAIDGCRGSPFHQGDNERGHRYDDITLICRSGSKLEQFIEMAREAGDERKQSGKRTNVKKIMEGLELVRSRIAPGGDTGDDNQQSEGGLLAAGVRAG